MLRSSYPKPVLLIISSHCLAHYFPWLESSFLTYQKGVLNITAEHNLLLEHGWIVIGMTPALAVPSA